MHVLTGLNLALIPNFSDTHWSMFTLACRWQCRLAVRYIAGFLEQNASAHDKLTEMVCLLTLILNRKTYHLAHIVLMIWHALEDLFLHFAIIAWVIQKSRLFSYIFCPFLPFCCQILIWSYFFRFRFLGEFVLKSKMTKTLIQGRL